LQVVFTKILSVYNLDKHQVEVTLRLTVSQSVCLGIEHPCGACDQILLPVGMLLSEIYGAPSLTRGRVCNLQCNHSMVRVAQNPKPFFTVCVSAAKLKPLIFYAGLHLSRCHEHLHCQNFVWPLLGTCTIPLLQIYTCSAFSDGGHLQQIRRDNIV
jgi:hypothetical protein